MKLDLPAGVDVEIKAFEKVGICESAVARTVAAAVALSAVRADQRA